MKHLLNSIGLTALVVIASCSNNGEPEFPVFMQPSAIATADENGNNQTFEYDEYGRIVAWTLKSNSTHDVTACTAHYSYPNDKTILVKSEEFLNGHDRIFEETIWLINGRAAKSEGTFTSSVNGLTELQKTYRLEFEYDSSNHLTIVRHAEVVGIGDDLNDVVWNKPWIWENYLIWEDGNLKEFQDFQGNNTITKTTKYDYSIYAIEYPVIIPMVINNAHHAPLFMQGVFGLNSVNLVKTAEIFDSNDNMNLSRQYTYEFEQTGITGFAETTCCNAVYSKPVTYEVTWTEKFNCLLRKE